MGLVLSRKVGERIMIGDDVSVELVSFKRGIAKLRIVAPLTIRVHRQEVFDAIHKPEGGEPCKTQ